MAYNPTRPTRIGNLRDRVTWQQNAGGDVWTDMGGKEPARIEPLKGQEMVAGFSLDTIHSLSVYVRWRFLPSVENVRLVWETFDNAGQPTRLVLSISSVENPDERRRFLRLICSNEGGEDTGPAPEPDTDGALLNPGAPFENTQGWDGVGASIQFNVSDEMLRLTTTIGHGHVATPMLTTPEETYYVEVVTGSGEGTARNVRVIAANSPDGVENIAASGFVGPDSQTFVEFTAEEDVTWIWLDPAVAVGNVYVVGLVSGRLGEELLSNPGNPFPNTTGWTPHNGGDMVAPFSVLYLDNATATPARATQDFVSEIGKAYRVRLWTSDDTAATHVPCTVAASSESDGTSPIAESPPIGIEDSGAIAFAADATTTRFTILNTTLSSGFEYSAHVQASARPLLQGNGS